MTSIQARIVLLTLLVAACAWAAACTREHREPPVIPGPQLGESTASPPLDPTAAPPDAAGPVEITAGISPGALGTAPVQPQGSAAPSGSTSANPAGTTLAPSDTPPVAVPVAPSVTPIPPNAPVPPSTPAPNAPATPPPSQTPSAPTTNAPAQNPSGTPTTPRPAPPRTTPPTTSGSATPR